jgi:hypothetical protein
MNYLKTFGSGAQKNIKIKGNENRIVTKYHKKHLKRQNKREIVFAIYWNGKESMGSKERL